MSRRRSRTIRRLADYVWAGPASLIGLLVSPFFARRRVVDGVLVCEGAGWPRKLGWRYTAITFGHVVLSTAPVTEDLMEHETVHVAQYERWGIFLLPAYAAASLWALIRGRRAYQDNPFERAARGER